jgi:5-methylcytosine-specific restriction protein A
MIRDNLLLFLSNYLSDKSNYTVASRVVPSFDLLTKTIVTELSQKSAVSKKYKVEGSIGKTNFAQVPWICVFDLDITESAQEGYYIVYLFKADMSGLYLSLNQGWTQYESAYTQNVARLKIKKNSLQARKRLKSIGDFELKEIELLATRPLGKGYELGNICSKYYSADNIPDDSQLINDLRNLMGIYTELKGDVGIDILEIENALEEDQFQNEIQDGEIIKIPPGMIPRKEQATRGASKVWVRNRNMSYTFLTNAGFKCENDPEHKTFITTKGHQFMEVHHLIPMEFQINFEGSLDVPENLISLCPNCHRAFHHSESIYLEKLLSKFYENRYSGLKAREINLEFSMLKNWYSDLQFSDDDMQ